MSSIVCQGLPYGLGLSFDTLKSEFSHPISFQKDTHDLENNNGTGGGGGGGGDLGGWSSSSSFIVTLAATNASPEMTAVETEEQVYIHPLASCWKSSTLLSTKSLEICTEGLGSETGSNIDELIDDLLSNPPHSIEKQRQRQSQVQRSKKTNRNVSFFPPPLTSISGSETTRVRPYRECGRLVLKATSFSNSSFQAERADGRLRLYYSILKDGYENDKEDEQEEEMGRIENEKLVEMEEFPVRTSKSCKEAGPGTGMPLSWGPYWVPIS